MPRTLIDPAAEMAAESDTILDAAGLTRSSDELLPQDRAGRSQVTSLPQDLQAGGARRLRVVVALYAFAFFVSGPLTAALSADERAR